MTRQVDRQVSRQTVSGPAFIGPMGPRRPAGPKSHHLLSYISGRIADVDEGAPRSPAGPRQAAALPGGNPTTAPFSQMHVQF